MKKFSKIIALAMAAVMTFSISPALIAQAKETTLDAETVYLPSKNGSKIVSFSIYDLTKVDSVKSSKNAVLRPYEYTINIDNNQRYNYEYSKNAFVKDDYTYNSKYTNFTFDGVKAGTSNITVKSGGNTYKKTVTVKNYTNPLKSLIISNVNGGKNISGKFSRNSEAKFKGKNSKSIKAKAQVAGGWEITQINMSNTYSEAPDYESIGSSAYRYFKKGTSKGEATLNYYNYKKPGYVRVSCRNKTTKGTIEIYARINQPNN